MTRPRQSLKEPLLLAAFVYVVFTCPYILQAHGGHHGNQQPPSKTAPSDNLKKENHKKSQNFTKINIEHIKHHLKEFGMGLDQNIEQIETSRLEFYHFKVHDVNMDSRIDGLEMFRVLMQEEMDVMGSDIVDENDVAIMVDGYLEEVDTDEDGYIDFREYKANSHFFITL